MTRLARQSAALFLATPLFLGAASLAGCGAAEQGTAESSPNEDPLETITAAELYRRGRLLTEGGDHIRAEQYIAAAIQRGFDEEEAMPALMQACLEASRLVAALQYAEPYLERHPEHWSLRMLIASIHMGLDNHTRARDELERVLRDTGDDPPAQAHYFLGVLYRDPLEDEERSAEHFRRYLALAPDGEHREEATAGAGQDPAARLPQRVPMPEGESESEAESEPGDASEGEPESEVL